MRFLGRICTSAALFTSSVLAQRRLTLAEAVAEALSNNPQITAAASRVEVAEGVRHQAALGPNPRLILQSENARVPAASPFSYPHDADSYAFLAQTIETGGKRGYRVEVAGAGLRRTELERELQRQQIVSRVRSTYWAAAGAARVQDRLQREITAFALLVQYQRDRFNQGAAPELDLLRAELEQQRLVSASITANQEAERSRIALFRQMGKSEFPRVEFTEPLEHIEAVQILSMDQVLQRRPELRIAREIAEQARLNLRLQQANAKPDPDAQLGYKRTFGFNTLYLAVQIPLPVRNRNQGQIEAASAEIRAAESTLAATEALVKSELETAKADLDSRRRLLSETVRPMSERAEEVYRISDAAYREGGLDFLRLLDAQRANIEAQLAYVRLLSELHQSEVALQTAEGDLP